MPSPEHANTRQELIEAQVEQTMKAYENLLPPSMADTFRNILREALTTNPTAMALIDGIVGYKAPVTSDVHTRPDAETSETRSVANGERKGGS